MSAYVSWAKGHRNKEGGDRMKTQIEKRGEEAKVRRRLRGRASGASRNKGQHAHAHAHTHTRSSPSLILHGYGGEECLFPNMRAGLHSG